LACKYSDQNFGVKIFRPKKLAWKYSDQTCAFSCNIDESAAFKLE
jgi:hypothetical protein